jgi:two-component system sensor histidine kinase KdpD
VTDRGAGLDPSDRSLLGQKFFRGKRHAQSSSGLGLGFWIANAFVGANQGTVEAASEGVNNGMAVKIRLPLAHDSGLWPDEQDRAIELSAPIMSQN